FFASIASETAIIDMPTKTMSKLAEYRRIKFLVLSFKMPVSPLRTLKKISTESWNFLLKMHSIPKLEQIRPRRKNTAENNISCINIVISRSASGEVGSDHGNS